MTGPTRIVGGPQSGKTALLAELTASWIGSGQPPERARLVVRSRSQAEPLRRRLAAILPPAHPAAVIVTHEGLAREVLERLGVREERERLSPPGEWLAMRATLREASPLPRLRALVSEPSCVTDCLSVVSACKRALVGPGLLAARLRDAPDALKELAVVSDSYERTLERMGGHDGRDAHRSALDALMDQPMGLRGWADLLLVDEAEDLSPAQWLLIRELGLRLTAPQRLVMAGSPLTATPGFRGASSEASSRPFEEYFPAELRPRDWTLAEAHPDWAADLLGRLRLPRGQDLASSASVSAAPTAEAALRLPLRATVWRARDETGEAEAIAREIAVGRLQGDVDLDDVAILLRSPQRQLPPLLAALTRQGLPVAVAGPASPAGHSLVEVVLAWIRVLARPGDDTLLAQALGCGPLGVSPAALEQLRREALTRQLSQAECFFQAQNDWAAQASEESRQLNQARMAWPDPISGLLLRAREELDRERLAALLGEVELASGVGGAARDDRGGAAALATFARIAEAVVDAELRLLGAPVTLERWLEALTPVLRHAAGPGRDLGPQPGKVSILSLRQAKGLTWRWVFIPGCVAGNLPQPGDVGGLLDRGQLAELLRCLPELEDVFPLERSQEEAEARLFLMGLTRARARVTCSWSERVGGRSAERSAFLDPLGPEDRLPRPLPWAGGTNHDDLVRRLALAPPPGPPPSGLGALALAATRLRRALSPFDPVDGAPALLGQPLSLSATAIARWLACPRQYLAGLLTDRSEGSLELSLGKWAHRLLERAYRQRQSWNDDPQAFRACASRLLQAEILGEARLELPGPVERRCLELGLEAVVDRWARLVVDPGAAVVGEPLGVELPFTLEREGWRLTGRADAIWRHADGTVEIVDYKTRSEAEREGELRNQVFGKDSQGPVGWQLPIYQLAAQGGAFAELLGARQPDLMRNWYLAVEPRPKAPRAVVATGFRMVAGEGPEGPGSLAQGELDRVGQAIADVAVQVGEGRFPAQPQHQQRTCRDQRVGCALSAWCDGEGSVGAKHQIPESSL
ncbi:MAG: PD-(D/E)XK nuclease family protein [Candidatus Dormibacteria bacterium]